MNGILITVGDGGDYGYDAMANTIQICDCLLEGKKDGDEVEVNKVKGVLVEHEGMRFIAVHSVDGEPVHEMEEMEEEREIDHSMDSNDALEQFMKNRKG